MGGLFNEVFFECGVDEEEGCEWVDEGDHI